MEKETLKNKIKRIIPFTRIQRITGGRSQFSPTIA